MSNNLSNYSKSYDSVIGNEWWKGKNFVSKISQNIKNSTKSDNINKINDNSEFVTPFLQLTYSFYKISESEKNTVKHILIKNNLSNIEKSSIKQSLKGNLLSKLEKNAIKQMLEKNDILDTEKNALKHIIARNELSNLEQDAVKQALKKWENVVNIKFIEISNYEKSNIKFKKDSLFEGVNGNTCSTILDDMIYSVCITLNNKNFTNCNLQNLEKGHQGFKTILHEIGHALGLKHSAERSESDNSPFLTEDKDYQPITIMSYESISKMYKLFNKIHFKYSSNFELNFNKPENHFYPYTPSVFDIAAIQKMYGANMNFNSNDTVYNFNYNNPNFKQFFTIWDPSGTDIFDASKTNSNNLIDLRPGELHISNVGNRYFSLAYGTYIEKVLSGAGDDVIISYHDNIIYTGSGNDIVYLGYGRKSKVHGCKGKKTFIVDKNNLKDQKSITEIYNFKDKTDKICFVNYDHNLKPTHKIINSKGDLNTHIKFDNDMVEIILCGVGAEPIYDINYA